MVLRNEILAGRRGLLGTEEEVDIDVPDDGQGDGHRTFPDGGALGREVLG